MEKSDYIYMIIDNFTVFGITLPENYQIENLYDILNQYEEHLLKIIAGFNKQSLERFISTSSEKKGEDLVLFLRKMELISYMTGPLGNLHYLSPNQINYILGKIESLKLEEITEEKISNLGDEQLEKEFGGNYSTSLVLENQLASAEYYLTSMGYSQKEIEEKFNEVKRNPSKLEALFSLPQKEIYSLPSEMQQEGSEPPAEENTDITIDHSQKTEEAINQHINEIQHENSEERVKKVSELMQQIIDQVKEKMTDQYEKVFKQIHPDRLERILKMVKQTKRKSKRMDLLLDWFVLSHILSGIELKVEHWQVSSRATQGNAGVYTAGIDFSRYDNIIKEYSDHKLMQVVNSARTIMQNPTKRAIQKLGQSLIASTGFDEHLYFTD